MAERDRPLSPASSTFHDTFSSAKTLNANSVSAPSAVGDLELPIATLALEERYTLEQPLGEGGMGRVLLYKDTQIGRRVAFKVIRAERALDETSRARFLREARIQAQLEHPAIVPVYDLGVDAAGAVYFTMKRIRGVTLRDVIDALRAGDADAAARFTRRKLLTAFGSACLAIELAHERGVLHRDLKPENVMLGDFGEIYVLDWGVAKVFGAHEDRSSLLGVDVPPSLVRETGGSAVLGTPGYMAPEQLLAGEPLGPACDIYALGAILFEILTLAPLHDKRTSEELVASTVAGADARASLRAPERDIAPELDAICVRATARAPSERFASARELEAAIERFLDGERDVELRRTMAATHARLAAEAAARQSLDDRRAAMREVGRALALDPDNAQAASTMARLLTEPPRDLPPEVEREMDRSQERHRRWMGRVGSITYTSILLYVPLLLWPGVRSWWSVLAFVFPLVAAAAISLYQGAQKAPRDGPVMLSMLLSNVAFAAASVFYGPLVAIPSALALNTTAYAVHLQGRRRTIAVVTALVAFLLPFALEVLRVVGPSYAFAAGAMTILPRAIELPQAATLTLLALAGVVGIVTGVLAVSHVRDALADAERSLYLYAWHLRELVPEGARTDPAPVRPTKRPPPTKPDDRATRPMARYS